MAAVARGDRSLGLDLLAELAPGDNVMISPYSVATALSMVHAGARGETASEIGDVLHLEVDDETLHAVRNRMDQSLANIDWEPPDEEDTRDPFVIRPANSAWGQGGYPFRHSFLEILATHYGAGLRLTDFAGDPDSATDTINEWTEEATEGRIEELIPPDVIDRLTRLVLVNAIWFQGNWENQFDPQQTEEGTFSRLDGSTVTAPLMRQEALRADYAETPVLQAVRLPYTGNASMVVALPREGAPADLVAELRSGDWALPWEVRLVDVTLPRFEFDSDVPLRDALEAVGMPTAFEPPLGESGADFTGIVPVRELYVKDALHSTSVTVDEHGTEAAAATAMVMNAVSAPPPATFTADRPFLFWIEHTPTGEWLFLGRVTDPS
ncbi:MAG: serpin family protein [Actinomycetota bacterium]